jgi:hypothetical protein
LILIIPQNYWNNAELGYDLTAKTQYAKRRVSASTRRKRKEEEEEEEEADYFFFLLAFQVPP